ncbi:MAG: hypothetical protein LIP01_11130 [Tannerellaceae bacterium]|nr:hypothetical protein [Tannerellaceae bacterium]
MEAKLQPDLDKDFERFKKEIKNILSAEIVKRYYHQKGELVYTLKEDPVLEKAIEALTKPEVIEETLKTPVLTEENNPKTGLPTGKQRKGIA